MKEEKCAYVDDLSGGNGTDVIWHDVPATKLVTYNDQWGEGRGVYCNYHFLIRRRQFEDKIVSIEDL